MQPVRAAFFQGEEEPQGSLSVESLRHNLSERVDGWWPWVP